MIPFTKSALRILGIFFLFFRLQACENTLLQKEAECKEEFNKLWNEFTRDGKSFIPWKRDWTEEELRARYDQMVIDRWVLYFVNPEDYKIPNAIGRYNDRFKIPDNWESWNSRYPYPLSFSYNLASPHYNASLLCIHGYRILAIESPSNKNFQAFYQLFDVYQISDFVHLFSPMDSGETHYPYWDKKTVIEEGKLFLNFFCQKIRFFPFDHWVQRHDVPPETLLQLVKNVAKSHPPEDLLGVSCRAGTGRTGTFTAAFILLSEINKQLSQEVAIENVKVEIDKLIWELCLQRPFIVPHFCQYKTLYQFIDCYINELLILRDRASNVFDADLLGGDDEIGNHSKS
jgi:hypothetical protein